MKIRAVAFDMDDTLLRDDRTVSDYTVSVLRRAADAGVKVIPASGRARDSLLPFVRELGCVSCFIGCNGAELWNPEGELLHRETFPPETMREIFRFGEEHACYAQTYYGRCFYYSMEGPFAEKYAAYTMLDGVYTPDLISFCKEPAAKILMMADEEKIARMLSEARDLFGDRCQVTCSKPYYLEFNPPAATKGNALRQAGELLGFSMAETAAFGDSLNDLSMLLAAGHGVAMANAREDVKARVGEICLSNMEDGVARYIEDRVLPCAGQE